MPADITEGALERIFSKYGEVLGLKIIPARASIEKTCAIIRYGDNAAADAAIEALHQKYEIRLAKPNPLWDSR